MYVYRVDYDGNKAAVVVAPNEDRAIAEVDTVTPASATTTYIGVGPGPVRIVMQTTREGGTE